MEEKQTLNAKMYYRQLISKLKVLSIRAEYNGKKVEAQHYKDIYKKMEKLQERIHLPLIGEETKEKVVYNEILELLVNAFQGNTQIDEEILNIAKEIEELCKQYDIQYNKKEEKEEEQQII